MADGFIIDITPDAYPGAGLSVPLGQQQPKVNGGTGRWTKVNRPRRRDMIEFDGEDPVELVFSIILDQYPDGNVEPLIERMYGWTARIALPFEPTVIHLNGPVPFAQLAYVLTGVKELDMCERRLVDGARSRQELELTFLEYIPGDLLSPSPVSAPVAAQQAAAPAKVTKLDLIRRGTQSKVERTHTVAKGETLSSIAAKELGDMQRWPEIGNLNGIRDSRFLKVGQVLRLP